MLIIFSSCVAGAKIENKNKNSSLRAFRSIVLRYRGKQSFYFRWYFTQVNSNAVEHAHKHTHIYIYAQTPRHKSKLNKKWTQTYIYTNTRKHPHTPLSVPLKSNAQKTTTNWISFDSSSSSKYAIAAVYAATIS